MTEKVRLKAPMKGSLEDAPRCVCTQTPHGDAAGFEDWRLVVEERDLPLRQGLKLVGEIVQVRLTVFARLEVHIEHADEVAVDVPETGSQSESEPRLTPQLTKNIRDVPDISNAYWS